MKPLIKVVIRLAIKIAFLALFFTIAKGLAS